MKNNSSLTKIDRKNNPFGNEKQIVIKRSSLKTVVKWFFVFFVSVLFLFSSFRFLRIYRSNLPVVPLVHGFLLLDAVCVFLFVLSILKNKSGLFRATGLLTVFASVVLLFLSLIKRTGLIDKFSSVSEVVSFIRQKGTFAALSLYIVTLLQVVILPIPGVVTFTAGVTVFGVLKGYLICFAGIFSGSLVAFFIGRKFGMKAVSFVIGEKTMRETMKKFNGKDKLFLTFAFLFPFFPDDALCFVAGLSSMSFKYFFFVVLITRLLSGAFSSLALGGYLFPFDSWWGISLWIIFALIMGLFTLFVSKNTVKIESFFANLKEKTIFQRKKRFENPDCGVKSEKLR